MMNFHCFSLIVACHNAAPFLKECLDSLIGQSYPVDLFEVYCIDDGSTDRTSGIIQSYGRSFPFIKFFSTGGSGLEKTCNLGISAAKFPYIIRVDADDVLESNYLQIMNDAMHQNPDFDFYYCKEYIEYYSPAKWFTRELPDFDPEEIFSRGDFFATGTIYQKSQLEGRGGFPEEIPNCGLENYAVILDFISKGKKGFAVSGAGFKYRRHDTNMSTLKRGSIIEYGKALLHYYGRTFRTNEYHPYGLVLEGSCYS